MCNGNIDTNITVLSIHQIDAVDIRRAHIIMIIWQRNMIIANYLIARIRLCLLGKVKVDDTQ